MNSFYIDRPDAARSRLLLQFEKLAIFIVLDQFKTVSMTDVKQHVPFITTFFSGSADPLHYFLSDVSSTTHAGNTCWQHMLATHAGNTCWQHMLAMKIFDLLNNIWFVLEVETSSRMARVDHTRCALLATVSF